MLIHSCLQAVEDVNVTYEDQQRINKFARNTSRMTELKNEIEAKKVSKRCVLCKAAAASNVVQVYVNERTAR